MRLKEGMPLNDHIIKVINILGQLDVYGVVMPDKLKLNLILQSLSSSYRPFIMNYNLNRIEHTLPKLLNEIQKFYIQGRGYGEIHVVSSSGTKNKQKEPQKGPKVKLKKKNFKKVEANVEKAKVKG